MAENRYPGASSRVLRGDEHGVDVIIGISSYPHGVGPPEHRHHCAEVFVVHEGRGVYTVDGVDAIAEPGDVVVLPANAWHYFRGDGEVPLRHVAVLDSAHPGLERKTT